MKLLVCIIDNVYANEVELTLKKEGYRMTEITSTGGFWRKGNKTFLFGIENEDLDQLQNTLKQTCIDVEQKKQRKSKQAYRYTSFLIDAKDAGAFINL